MRIDPKALGLAAGVVVGGAFAACAIAVSIAPASMMTFLGWVLHVDLNAMARPVTLANVIGGAAIFAAYVGVIVGLTAVVYNRLTTRRA